jgi:hypothetical protein
MDTEDPVREAIATHLYGDSELHFYIHTHPMDTEGPVREANATLLYGH